MSELTEQEVGTLRKIIRDNSPMPAVNGSRAGEPTQPSEGPFIQRLENEAVQSGPMKVQNLNDDHVVAHKLRKAGFSKMKPGECYGLGISRQQIMELSASELKALIIRFQSENSTHQEYTIAAPPEKPNAFRTMFAS